MKIREFSRVMWNTVFGPIPELEPSEFNKYRDEHEEKSFVLLDVRQPHEYEEDHIPGAQLIPLPVLSERYRELDPGKPVLAYCAIGGRSRAAAEFLSGRGFHQVYSLKGGINAWAGIGAEGDEADGMALLRGDETPAQALAVAYALENGLGSFYKALGEVLENKELADLLQKLGKVEAVHKEKVMQLFEKAKPTDDDRKTFENLKDSGVMEGGYQLEIKLKEHKDDLPGSAEVLDLAMTIEAQAMDLYMRMAHKFSDQEAGRLMLELSEDEKKHLGALGRMLEQIA